MNAIGFMVSKAELIEDGQHRDTWRIEIDATLPKVREDMPDRLKESLTRMRLLALTGKCPCGGVTIYDGETMRQRHLDNCLGDDVLELMRAWFGVER